uniref:SET domain-containing protein n=1 Tax=Culex tarsalis TaxID=7177 RepID=A0A1Q3EVD4_CULTA
MDSPAIDTLRRRFDREVPRRNADIVVYRDFVTRHDALLNVPEVGKDDGLAIRYRHAGNRAFSNLQFNAALVEFNRSICFADNRSEQLGLGYGCRSALYYEAGEYEFALYNIDLARKHNYPVKLLPKLLAREVSCRDRIAEGHSKGTASNATLDINVDANPSIPFVANGISMAQYDGMGRGLVAVHDFNTGDVILNEPAELCFGSFERSYTNCAHCGAEFRSSLIPCPGCVSYMYCGKECRKESFRTVHRFECKVATKLTNVTCTNMLIAARMFFHGLTAFNDNITEYLNYCRSYAAIDSRPLELRFPNPDPVDVFKVLHHTKPNRNRAMEHTLKLCVTAFYAVFLKSPLVSKMFYTAAQRIAMLRSLLLHGRVCASLVLNQEDERGGWFGALSPIATLLNHSCDPNATAFIDSGKIKIVVLRPIQKGDQISISYQPVWWNAHAGSEQAFLCQCVVCDRGPEGVKWHLAHKQLKPISQETKRELCEEIDDQVPAFIKFKRIIHILARDGHHPGELFSETVKMYNNLLAQELQLDCMNRNRAKLMLRIAFE